MNKDLEELFLNFYDKEDLSSFRDLLKKLRKNSIPRTISLNHNDRAFLIYPHALGNLKDLNYFLKKYNFDSIFNSVHILPFLTSDADGGFAVSDYTKVERKYGSWKTISSISQRFKLLSDLVLNHTSTSHHWFKNFLQDKNRYYITSQDTFDYSNVFRPRTSQLLTKFNDKKVWTTFSDKQVDLDFSNIEVFFEFLKIISFYNQKGISILRLDAIPYIIKQSKTSCVNLEETYSLVSLIINSGKTIAPGMKFLCEANFGDTINELYLEKTPTDMVYDFTFPLLLVHSIYKNDFTYFLNWAKTFNFENETVFFLSNHDGIACGGINELFVKKDFNQFISAIKNSNIDVSYKMIHNKKEAYELNTTFYSLLENLLSGNCDQKYLFCFNILLMIKGFSLIYYIDIIKGRNDYVLYQKTKEKRSLNRSLFTLDEYESRLNNSFFEELKNLLKIRKILDFENHNFRIYQKDNFLFLSYENKDEVIFSISNVSHTFSTYMMDSCGYYDLLEGKFLEADRIQLNSYEFKWIKIKK